MAEAQQESEREQAEEEAARQEIEDAIAEAEYRELSQDEQTYLDYGEFKRTGLRRFGRPAAPRARRPLH